MDSSANQLDTKTHKNGWSQLNNTPVGIAYCLYIYGLPLAAASDDGQLLSQNGYQQRNMIHVVEGLGDTCDAQVTVKYHDCKYG